MSGRKRSGSDGRAPGAGGYTKSGKPRPGSGGNRKARLEGKGPTPPGARPSLPPLFRPLIGCSACSSPQLPSRAFRCVLDRHPDVRQGVPDGVRRSIVAAGPCRFPLPQRQPGKRVHDRVQPVAGVA